MTPPNGSHCGSTHVQDNVDIRYGGIGGLSEFLGWTEVQRQNTGAGGAFGGYQNVLKVVGARF